VFTVRQDVDFLCCVVVFQTCKEFVITRTRFNIRNFAVCPKKFNCGFVFISFRQRQNISYFPFFL